LVRVRTRTSCWRRWCATQRPE